MNKITSLFIVLFSVSSIFAQVTLSPKVDRKDEYTLVIEKIEHTASNTIVHCLHTAPFTYEKGGWVNIRPNTYLIDRATSIKYPLLEAKGIPTAPGKHQYANAGQTLSFRLIFPKLPSSCRLVDFIECENDSSCFNFYGVHLSPAANAKNGASFDLGTFYADFDAYCFYNPVENTWTKWDEGDIRGIFNINRNGDIKIVTASSEQLFVRIGEVEEGSLDNGDRYKIIDTLDEEGEEVSVQLFMSGDMKLIYPRGFIIQFANSIRF